MDTFMFESLVRKSKEYKEPTSYLEFYIYDDPTFNDTLEGKLLEEDFEDWFHQWGSFAPKSVPRETVLLGSLRLFLQKDCHPLSFEPGVLSMSAAYYKDMISTLNLSYRQIESTNCAKAFFWSVTCQNEENHDDDHLQLIYRNIQGPRAGICKGFELLLTYVPKSRCTTGFFRGTSDSIMDSCIEHLKAESTDVPFPMLLPTILLVHEMNTISNAGIQCSRQMLFDVEEKIAMQDNPQTSPDQQNLSNLERCLLEVHKKVIEKHPQTQLEVIKGLERTFREFFTLNPFASMPSYKSQFLNRHQKMNGALAFYRTKLEGINADVTVTLSRIEMLRSAVQNLLSITLANDQKEAANMNHQASLRYNQEQHRFSILGVLFLPGTFFAAIFSTTFFNFQAQPGDVVVSRYFWVFWALTIPTMILLALSLSATKFLRGKVFRRNRGRWNSATPNGKV